MEDDKECIEATHKKGLFTVHLCSVDGKVTRGRIFTNLWTKWDKNLSDKIDVENDERIVYEIPEHLLNYDAFINKLTSTDSIEGLLVLLDTYEIA